MSGCYFIQIPAHRFVNVPLPPAQGSGAVGFGRVFLSLSHVDTATTGKVDVAVYDFNGNPRITETVTIGTGRTVVAETLPGDMVARVALNDPNQQFDVSVLVEYQAGSTLGVPPGCYFVQIPAHRFVNVPLPPAQGSGVVKFGQVFLSLSHVDTATTGKVDVAVYDFNGKARIAETVTIGTGRTVVAETLPGDMVARVALNDPNQQFDVSVLVEYQSGGPTVINP